MTLAPADGLLLLCALLAWALARRAREHAPTARLLLTLTALSAVRVLAQAAQVHPAQGLRHGLDRAAWALAWGALLTWIAVVTEGVVGALWRRET